MISFSAPVKITILHYFVGWNRLQHFFDIIPPKLFSKSSARFQFKVKLLHLIFFGGLAADFQNNSALTKKLLSEILATRKLYVVPAVLKGETVIRFTVTSSETTREDIYEDWKVRYF